MAESLLNGLRALDLTDEKGFACGKILAALGVETIKVENPGGDPSRNIPPFLQDEKNPEKSLYWWAYNTDKRSITLNLDTNEGKSLFRKLVKGADFVIESFTPGHMDSLGLGYKDLKDINPGIIMTSITPFGQKGPYAHYKGSELIVSAMSGVMETNGDPDRAPVREGPDSVFFESNAAAVLGTIMAYNYRVISGQGQHVDVSQQEVAAKRGMVNISVWEADRRLMKRNGPIRTFGSRSSKWIWPCKDGYVFWSFMGGKSGAPANSALSKWLDEEGINSPFEQTTKWEELDMAAVSLETLAAHEAAITEFFSRYTKKEITEEGVRRGINASAVNNAADILIYHQLQARNYWAEIDSTGSGRKLNYPKYFFLSNLTENYVRGRAPQIGEDNDEIYVNQLGMSPADIAAYKEAGVI
ncbi:CaiB/BaiF CoA transferase family protein [Thermodesulfobacteriota bacterium]